MASISASIVDTVAASRARRLIIVDSATSATPAEKGGVQNLSASELPVLELESNTNLPGSTASLIDSGEQEQFKKGFRDCLMTDHSDYGMKSMAEVYVENWMSKGPFQVQLWLSEIYLEKQHDPDTLMALLKVMMHVDPVDFSPANRMIALASISHPSLEVRECAVRCYEYWETPAYYSDIAGRPLEPKWLEDYKQSFIN